jgi:DNA-directed RNA polymerase, mitochondrial
MTITREDIRRQIDLENEARDLGAVRYRQQRPLPWRSPDDTPSVSEEAELPPGRQLIKLAVEPTAALLREKIAAAENGKAGRRHSALGWLAMADPEAVAYLSARVAVNSAIQRKLFQGVTRQLGLHIVDHVRMTIFSKENAGGYRGFLKSSKSGRVSKNRRAAIRKLLTAEAGESPLTDAEQARLGAFALETLIEATGFFTLDRGVSGRGGEGYILRPTETVEDWLSKQHARSELLDPILMPMVVRPKRWRSQYVGGYLTPVIGNKLVKVPSSAKAYTEDLKTRDLSKVYEAVNHVQETPWRVNRRVLEVMREVWDSGGVIGGLPSRLEEPLPAKPADIDENEESLKAWKRAAAEVYERNASETSKRLALHQRIWIAERFAEEPAIWFPHQMDFRGRVYPMPSVGVHPQADDTGKALLEFAHGLPLGVRGGWWLAVHIANLFGIDKVSFADRVQWTYDHAAQLIDSALAPLDGDRFWTTADSPWMALAAIFDFAAFLKDDQHVSHLPIPLDGSNSGLQHFSAMLRDPVGAAAVNLVPADKPQDVYLAVAEAAQRFVDADEDPEAAPWKGDKVTRKVAKRPTMTFVYSATRFGMHEMVLQTLREIDAENAQRGLGPHLGGADNYAAARYLSHVLFDAMEEVVRAASGAMGWLRAAAKLAAEADLPVQWTAPDGLPVLQAYREVWGERHIVHWMGRRLTITLAVNGSKLSARGQANGIAPNFVHSLDAAHLRAVAREARARGIDYLAVIHDSFGTHAARTDELVDILRDTFVEQYRPDVLAGFRDELLAQLPPALVDKLKPLPAKGSLDLNEVERSAYLFA